MAKKSGKQKVLSTFAPELVERKGVTLPERVLQQVSAKHPGVWRLVEEIRARPAMIGWPRGWEQWCYAPVDAVGSALLHIHGQEYPSREIGHLMLSEQSRLVTALAAWRMTKGVYAFDPDIADALFNSGVSDDVPVEILLRLPEWCVYVPTPGLKMWQDVAVHGFFAHIDDHGASGHGDGPELHLELMADPGASNAVSLTEYTMGNMVQFFEQFQKMQKAGSSKLADGVDQKAEFQHIHLEVKLGRGSLQQAFKEHREEMERHTRGERLKLLGADGVDLPENSNDSFRARLAGKQQLTREEVEEKHRAEIDLIQRLTNLLLYLCAEDVEISQDGMGKRLAELRAKEKNGKKTYAADRITSWEVGVRIGSALRDARTRDEQAGGGGEGGGSVRPHIRRAHFHRFWAGAEDTGKRLVLRWLSPIGVKIDKAGELPIVVRPVDTRLAVSRVNVTAEGAS